MRRPLVPPSMTPQAIAGGALVLVLLAECMGGKGTPDTTLPAPAHHVVPLAPVGHHGNIAAEAAAIDARPLFAADRRPPAEAAIAGPANAAPRLSAILIGGSEPRCVFDNGGHPLFATAGGHAGPYTIVAIAADRVTVDTPEGRHVLRPTALPPGSAAAGGTSEPEPGFGRADNPNGALQNLMTRLRNLRGL